MEKWKIICPHEKRCFGSFGTYQFFIKIKGWINCFDVGLDSKYGSGYQTSSRYNDSVVKKTRQIRALRFLRKGPGKCFLTNYLPAYVKSICKENPPSWIFFKGYKYSSETKYFIFPHCTTISCFSKAVWTKNDTVLFQFFDIKYLLCMHKILKSHKKNISFFKHYVFPVLQSPNFG